MTNCIMGFAYGRDYNWSTLAPFVKSAREKAKFDGDIVLFTLAPEGLDTESKKKLAQYGVVEKTVDMSWIPWGQGFMMARFWQQEKAIVENTRWDRLLLVDTRDMIFQSDLGAFFSDDGLHCAKEAISIGQDIHFNARGVRESWGEKVFEEMKDMTVLNSGSIWGGRLQLLNLINTMHSCGALPNCDQHAMMYSVYKLGLPATLHENDGSMIWTIGVVFDIPFEFKDGYSIMPDGKIPPIVHQYDRHAELKAKILEYYK